MLNAYCFICGKTDVPIHARYYRKRMYSFEFLCDSQNCHDTYDWQEEQLIQRARDKYPPHLFNNTWSQAIVESIIIGNSSAQHAMNSRIKSEHSKLVRKVFRPFVSSLEEYDKFEIDFAVISFTDWILISIMGTNVYLERYQEDWQHDIGQFIVLPLMKDTDLNEYQLPSCKASPYISSNERIYRNCYNSNADVMAQYMALKVSMCIFFIYLIFIDTELLRIPITKCRTQAKN